MLISPERMQLKFAGTELPSGTISARHLADSLGSLSDALTSIGVLQGIDKKKLRIDVRALKEGSFEVDLDFLLKCTDAGVAVLPLISDPSIPNVLKIIVRTLRESIEAKIALLGQRPKSVTINQADGSATIVNVMGQNNIVHLTTYNALQDKPTNRSIRKMLSPLTDPDSKVEKMEIGDSVEERPTEIEKGDAMYFEGDEELQTVPEYSIRGTVSALDRKTWTGRLSVDKKRVHFEVSPDIHELQRAETLLPPLVDSLKAKVPLLLIGEAALDYSGHVKKLYVKRVQSETRIV